MASPNAIRDSLKDELRADIVKWFDSWACEVPKDRQHSIPAYLLAGIYLKLGELTRALAFGATYFRITPVALTAAASPVRILERETGDRVRKVSVWVDSASGGPTPTIRISTGASGNTGNGIRINAGQVNTLGEVPPQVELWAASTATINLYVVEQA